MPKALTPKPEMQALAAVTEDTSRYAAVPRMGSAWPEPVGSAGVQPRTAIPAPMPRRRAAQPDRTIEELDGTLAHQQREQLEA